MKEKFSGAPKRRIESTGTLPLTHGCYGEESRKLMPELEVDEAAAKANRARQEQSKKSKVKAKISLGGNFGKNK